MYLSVTLVGIVLGLFAGCVVGWVVRGLWDRIVGITVRVERVPFWRHWW